MVVVNIPIQKHEKQISYYLDDRIKDKFDLKVIPSLHKKDKDFVIAIDGGEGCLSRDTLIKTSDGDKTIEELFNLGKYSIAESYNFNENKKEFGKIGVIDSGIKEVFEIETEDGRKIKATSNHKFFILRNHSIIKLPLCELKEGDQLICD